MRYNIKSVELLVRRIPPPRMDFSIGKGQSLFPDWMRGNVVAQLVVQSESGASSFGCSADWPSFGWLDKRSDVEPKQKLAELLRLLQVAKQILAQQGPFANAFEAWLQFQRVFLASTEARTAIPLCCSFATALFERALIDAVCRLQQKPFFEMLKQDLLGFEPAGIYAELRDCNLAECLPDQPLDQVHIRHTVGLTDLLHDHELTDDNRIEDGLPQTLQQYVQEQGITYFKIKVGSDADENLNRLQRVWEVVSDQEPQITLDGNESFSNADQLDSFVQAFAKSLPEVFQRTLFIEQPLNRAETHDTTTSPIIQKISQQIPLVIDESDGHIHAFRDATEIGYAGVSHKNCKGVFKSLANFALCQRQIQNGKPCFLTAEDLTNMPLVALQQDFAVAAALGLTHAERNGHHYFAGLSHLTAAEQTSAEQKYGELYARQNGNLLLHIANGKVDVSKLQCAGLGVSEEPNWEAMMPLEEWIAELV